jgi:signal transduction histidine kinase
LTVIDPRRLPHAASPRPPARIEDAIIDGSRVAASPKAPLPAGTRNVQIDYTSLRLTSPGQLRFRYKLEGFDREWVNAGSRRQAYYTLLNAGDYAFQVAASGDGATWGPTAVWQFSVRPAFYETAWFFGLAATCLGLVGWGTWRGRVWVVEQRFAAVLTERARLAREIHDTMLQSLVGLALQCQAIARRCDEGSEQREQLLDLRREVEEQIRAARQAILDIRSPIVETHGLVDALRTVGRRAFADAKAEFEILSDVRADRLPASVQGELFRIGQEAITNVAKHAAARNVRVELRSERNATTLRVSDDGLGFDYEAVLVDLNGHYGLISMRERAARLGGDLNVNSSPGRGTTVELVIPASAASHG